MVVGFLFAEWECQAGHGGATESDAGTALFVHEANRVAQSAKVGNENLPLFERCGKWGSARAGRVW